MTSDRVSCLTIDTEQLISMYFHWIILNFTRGVKYSTILKDATVLGFLVDETCLKRAFEDAIYSEDIWR